MNFWIWFSIPHCCLNHKLPHVRNANTDHFLFEEKGGKDYQGTSLTIMVLAFGKLVCLFHNYLPSHSRANLSPAFSKVSGIPQWKMRITLTTYLIYLSLIKVQYIVTVFHVHVKWTTASVEFAHLQYSLEYRNRDTSYGMVHNVFISCSVVSSILQPHGL